MTAIESAERSSPSDMGRAQAIQRVTITGAAVNVSLAVLKIVVGLVANSQALVADGIHSFSDLLTDGLVLFASRLAHQEADVEHPYGHARIETVATVGLGIFLIVVALALMVDAGHRLVDPQLLLHPGAIALLAALVSILANEWLFRYTMRVADRVGSGLLRANAWHHRSDAVSSVVVLVGVGGALLGLPYLDAFAAVAVALMIARVGWGLVWSSVEELVDKGLEPDRLGAINETLESVGGVSNVHMLRTRRMGGQAFVDVHVQVAPKLSVSEGHQIADVARARLLEQVDEVTDVTVHIDPEDDEQAILNWGSPGRREILAQLYERLANVIDREQILEVTLHYLSGRVDVDLLVPLSSAPDTGSADALSRQVQTAMEGAPRISTVRVLLEPNAR